MNSYYKSIKETTKLYLNEIVLIIQKPTTGLFNIFMTNILVFAIINFKWDYKNL